MSKSIRQSNRAVLGGWPSVRAAAPTWRPTARRCVFVAPHPDDEVLIMGGLLAERADAGSTITVVAVTDGEAAEVPDGFDPHTLAARRIDEQRAALHTLAPAGLDEIRLGLPDGEVGDHVSVLTEALIRAAASADLLVGPWIEDHHCDHVATARACLLAGSELDIAVVGGLSWAWLHGEPNRAGPHLRSLPLTPTQRDRRRQALACHRSQLDGSATISPVVPLKLAQTATWDVEYHIIDEQDLADGGRR